jgi:tetratricopeptide (TPR) repeat protein
VLELIGSNWEESRRVLTSAAEQARAAGLMPAWGRAELNLGVLAGRIGDYDGAARALSEGLRLTAIAQNTTEQLYATYNMAHLERERERFREAIDLYELVIELAERIDQVEVQAGAIAGIGLSCYFTGDLAGAQESLVQVIPLAEGMQEWFQGRELLVALRIHLLLTAGQVAEAAAVFEQNLTLATSTDVYGAAWLTAEFGQLLAGQIPGFVRQMIDTYGSRPEVWGNPKIREKFLCIKV